jgi:hypothetical protein
MLLFSACSSQVKFLLLSGLEIDEQGIEYGRWQNILENDISIQSNGPDDFFEDIPIDGVMRSGECVQSRNLTLKKKGAFYTPKTATGKALFFTK